MPDCREIIMSEEYLDFIVEYGTSSEAAMERFKDLCPQVISDRYISLYGKTDGVSSFGVANNTYSAIPKLYGLMDTTAVAATGAIRLQNQTGFELTGRGVLVGFIDTGPMIFLIMLRDRQGFLIFGIRQITAELFRKILIMEVNIPWRILTERWQVKILWRSYRTEMNWVMEHLWREWPAENMMSSRTL